MLHRFRNFLISGEIKVASAVQKLQRYCWRVNFAYWWSCIGKGLRLQPAYQTCFAAQLSLLWVQAWVSLFILRLKMWNWHAKCTIEAPTWVTLGVRLTTSKQSLGCTLWCLAGALNFKGPTIKLKSGVSAFWFPCFCNNSFHPLIAPEVLPGCQLFLILQSFWGIKEWKEL